MPDGGLTFWGFIKAVFLGTGGVKVGIGVQIGLAAARVALLGVANKVLTPKLKLTNNATEKLVTVRSAVAPRFVTFGEDLVSGPMLFANTSGSENRSLLVCVAVNGWACDTITDVYLDDKRIDRGQIDDTLGGGSFNDGRVADGSFGVPAGASVPAVVYVNRLTGREGFGPTLLTSSQPGLFDNTTHTFTGVPTITVRLDLVQGLEYIVQELPPSSIRALIRGQRVYDPRLDTTNGGNGNHRLNNSATWEWSENPALCLAHYLKDSEFGMGEDYSMIDWGLVTTAADDCDVLVDTPVGANHQKKYTCNTTLSCDETHGDNIELLVNAMLGRITFTGGKWRMWAGVTQTPNLEIDESWLRGDVQLQASASQTERANAIRGTYIDPDREYQPVAYIEQRSAAYETEDGERLYDDIDFEATQDQYEAQRKAIHMLRLTRRQKILFLECNWKGIQVQVGQVVWVTLDELNLSFAVYLVSKVDLSESGGIDLTLVEFAASDWTAPVTGDYSTRSETGQIDFVNQGVPAPTSLQGVVTRDGHLLNWVNPPDSTFKSIEIWASVGINDRGEAILFARTASNNWTNIYPQVALTYYWVRAVDKYGRYSSFHPANSAAGVGVVGGTNILNTDPSFGQEIGTTLTEHDPEFWYHFNYGNPGLGTSKVEIVSGGEDGGGKAKLTADGDGAAVQLVNAHRFQFSPYETYLVTVRIRRLDGNLANCGPRIHWGSEEYVLTGSSRTKQLPVTWAPGGLPGGGNVAALAVASTWYDLRWFWKPYLPDFAPLTSSMQGRSTYVGSIGFATTADAGTTAVVEIDSIVLTRAAPSLVTLDGLRLGGDSDSPAILFGSGTPEGNVTAEVGSLYMRTDGGSGTTLYVKESGSGNTGWAATT